MLEATRFMVEQVAVHGGYVWWYLPDLSRRWGEMEAKRSMIWTQGPGTPEMGQLFLDAWHATGNGYFYEAASKAAEALVRGQHESGGWNYVIDFAGEESLREWYETIGRNGWRLEEFQHYYGNATFDDHVTAQCARFLLRISLVKKDPRFRAAVDKAIGYVLESQYASGGWPQRYSPVGTFEKQGRPDYTGYVTLNDEVAEQNIDFLLLVLQQLGDERVREPIQRAMDLYPRLQQAEPTPGWALQYTTGLEPAGARSYEPRAVAAAALRHRGRRRPRRPGGPRRAVAGHSERTGLLARTVADDQPFVSRAGSRRTAAGVCRRQMGRRRVGHVPGYEGNHAFRIPPNEAREFEYLIAAGWSEGAVNRTADEFQKYVLRVARDCNAPVELVSARLESRRAD